MKPVIRCLNRSYLSNYRDDASSNKVKISVNKFLKLFLADDMIAKIPALIYLKPRASEWYKLIEALQNLISLDSELVEEFS